MPLYPLPVILVIAIWLLIFFSTGRNVIYSFTAVFVSGLVVYMIKAKMKAEWPFAPAKP
jgi:uncharacterized membrane-anchored protein YitT (DUF2179 family)